MGIAEKLPAGDRKFMVDFYNYHINVESDLEYHQCILDGSWPSAVTILTRALEDAKRKQKMEGRA